MTILDTPGLSTRAVHAGVVADAGTKAIRRPLVMANNYNDYTDHHAHHLCR